MYVCTTVLHTVVYKDAPSIKCNPIDVSNLKSWYLEHLFKDDAGWILQDVHLVLVKERDSDLEEVTKQGQINKFFSRKELLGELSDIFHYQDKPYQSCPHIILMLGGPGE